jgi:hypothetical protein
MKYHRICLICFDGGIKTAVNVTKHCSTNNLNNHLRKEHKQQYEETLERNLTIAKQKKQQTLQTSHQSHSIFQQQQLQSKPLIANI